MKMTSRDKELIFLALSLGIVAASWFFGAKNLEKKTAEVISRKEELQQEYDERMRILAKKDEYIQTTKDYNEAYQLMLTQYPGDISQVQQIMFVTGLEERFDTQVVSVSYTDPADIYQFQTTDPGNMAPYTLAVSTLQIPVELDYKQWKEFLDYVFSYQDKNTISDISASYNTEANVVDATVTMYQYAIRGEGRVFEEPKITVPIGTDNIFRSGTALSYDGGAVEQIEAIKKDYDCYIMLYPSASDMNAKVIAGPDDREKVVSDKNEEETLVIRAEENGETYSITYTLGENGRPHVLYPEGDTLDIYVLSSPRMGGTDLSQVKVQIENRTDKKMRIAVAGEDDLRPRFAVESKTGDVEILK